MVSNFPEIVKLYDSQQLTGDSANNDRYTIRTTHQYSQLWLVVRSKNGATRNAVTGAEQASIMNSIQNITLKCDGHTVKDYSGETCRRIATHELGYSPYILRTQAVGGTWAAGDDPTLGWDVAAFPLIFSPTEDYLGDSGAILPAPLYQDVSLYLKYNFPISATLGYASGASNHVFDLYGIGIPPEDTATMQNKSIIMDLHKYDYPTAASGWKDFDLTLNNNEWYRRLFIQAYYQSHGEGVDVTDVKLLINGKIYREAAWNFWQQLNARERGLTFQEKIYHQFTGATDAYWTRFPAMQIAYDPYTTPAAYQGASAAADVITFAGVAQDGHGVSTVTSRVNPQTVCIDLDPTGKMTHMLSSDPTKSALPGVNITSLQARLTQAGASSQVTMTEQRVIKALNL
jgi:hypothetical protein